jgi:hypothetical protein
MIYAAPAIVLVAVVLVLPRKPPKPNQAPDRIAPSGAYRLQVPIEDDCWRVTISTADGNRVEYRDKDSKFLGWFNVYWCWDSADRVWLYNSDDGQVYFWEKAPDGWHKTWWGRGTRGLIERDLAPPVELYPEYARKGMPQSLETPWDLRGFESSGTETRASFSRADTNESMTLKPGETRNGITLLSIDPDRRQVRVSIKGKERSLKFDE